MTVRLSLLAVISVALSTLSTSAISRDFVSLKGSSTVFPFATIVAEQLGKNPKFKTPVVESGGSSVGKKGVCDGTGTEFIDIGNASSRMKVKELREALTSLGVPAEGKKKDLVQILDEVVERAAAHALYQTLTVPALKDLLRENRQLLSGNKTELLERCVDGKLYGALTRCPECGGGRLRVHYPSQYGHGGQGEFHCPGFYDDDHYQRCSYTSHHVTRDPWREGESLEGPSPDAV